jgi:FKBP-type peptidyl-prolyl cis-trans isomerase
MAIKKTPQAKASTSPKKVVSKKPVVKKTTSKAKVITAAPAKKITTTKVVKKQPVKIVEIPSKSEALVSKKDLIVEEKWIDKTPNRIGIILALGVLVFGYFGLQASKNPCNSFTKPNLTATDKNYIPKSCMDNTVTLENGLKVKDIKIGDGEEIKSGDQIKMHYEGKLENGTVFDSSFQRGEPLPVTIGVGMVIKGWDQGVPGMKIGGERILTIPGPLAYGEAGVRGVIPPNSTLIFRVVAVSK